MEFFYTNFLLKDTLYSMNPNQRTLQRFSLINSVTEVYLFYDFDEQHSLTVKSQCEKLSNKNSKKISHKRNTQEVEFRTKWLKEFSLVDFFLLRQPLV